MENTELKNIKKIYGEKFSHLCRSLFPTILENEGKLTSILLSNFAPTHYLYEELKNNNMFDDFRKYIFTFVDNEDAKMIESDETPFKLLDKAGYILFPECLSEDEMMSYQKYYKPNEKLCSFNGKRLSSCRVWFAVKKSVKEIKRESFKVPSRQDEYGTSVLSFQFTKGDYSVLSIKNRYNHSVLNPDATFGNNLDNIIPGLTYSFIHTFGINLRQEKIENFTLPNFVKAKNGKFYKYNLYINDIYYCENNIIIKKGNVIQIDKSSNFLIDYFVLNCNEKTLKLYDENFNDSFVSTIGKIDKITVEKLENHNKKIIIDSNKKQIFITINQFNEIIGYKNEHIRKIDNKFLLYNYALTNIEIPNVVNIGDSFMLSNIIIKSINLPNVIEIGSSFLKYNLEMTDINLPKVKLIGNYFLESNEELENIELRNLQSIGDSFLFHNQNLHAFNAPKLQTIGNLFLNDNVLISKIDLPNVKKIGYGFLYKNKGLKKIDLPNINSIDYYFMYENINLNKFVAPNLKTISNYFLYLNKNLVDFYAPKLTSLGNSCLSHNEKMIRFYMPELKSIGDYLFNFNNTLQEFNIPKVEKIGDNCLFINTTLKKLNVSSLKNVGQYFLFHNNNIPELYNSGLEQSYYGFVPNEKFLKNMDRNK